ncbi:hypothetical protein ACFE04_003170 [Oxalis oulophora]
MDGNKEDALKSLQIGKDALTSGDKARALKFINKARRLDPTLPVDDLLNSLNNNSSTQTTTDDPQQQQQQQSSSSSIRNRKTTNNPNPSSAPASASASSYTVEQVKIVKEIKGKKDNYYEMLGIEKTSSVEDIRKAYRKLSLKVHPDKNNAPGAEEAFKLVSKAFQCLSNEDNRRTYDLHGSDEPARAATRRNGGGFNGYYDADVDAEEIFRNFFFGGMGPTTTQFRSFNFGPGMNVRTGGHNHGGGGGGGGGQAGGLRMLIQLLPVLLIVLLNFIPSSQPVYSLSRSYPYEYRITTQKGVNYYVRSTKFEQEYPPGSSDRISLERKVDTDYYQVVAQNCRFELQRQQWGFVRETPHCDLMRQFETAAAAAATAAA